MAAGSDNLKVAVRVRPFNERETKRKAKCVISMNGKSTTITNPASGDKKTFSFDYSYWSHDGFAEQDDGQLVAVDKFRYADQRTVFNDLGQGVLKNAWEGYNSTLFAYGQTGSGKSYSMIGHGNNKGIVPITCGELFQGIEKAQHKEKQLQVTFSMLEIYNERIRDLLDHKTSRNERNLKVREDSKGGFYVEGLRQHPCQNYKTIEQLMELGAVNRTTASTNMNATSSRSHMLITIKFKQVFNNRAGESTTKSSDINLVDLAGSERAESSGATGDRLKESSAINRSLLMLGTVIETLASGDARAIVPYRDSVLTKLLKSALGGNSKTVMIAALSPADINYEETLSTLRYANRAKKIKNRAVVNENPTDKLIRELKEENAKLKAQLTGRIPTRGPLNSDDVERLIKQNEQQMREMMQSWEQKLESERKKWENELKKTEERGYLQYSTNPYLQNVNEDPQLNGVIKHAVFPGTTYLGKEGKILTEDHPDAKSIVLRGLGILERHCKLLRTGNESVMIESYEHGEITINGTKATKSTLLTHGDRLKIGSNALFLYFGVTAERNKANFEIAKRYDYDFFQNELLETFEKNLDINVLKPKSKIKNTYDPVYLEYIQLMPVVAGINAMSEELQQQMEFSLIVKNLAACDAYGREEPREVAVKVRHKVTNQTWIWSKDKFMNRRYMIEELYMKHQVDPSALFVPSPDRNPFWDPVEDVFLGRAHVWLHSLAYRMSFQDEVSVHNQVGDQEALIQLSLSICSADGLVKGDEMMLIDPNDLIRQRFDLIVDIKHCSGLRWIKENSTRGIMLRYKFYNEQYGHQSRTIWHATNPQIVMKQRITVEQVDQAFLQYLHSASLIIELWGLQPGRVDRPDSPQDSGFFHRKLASSPPSSPSSSSCCSTESLEKELFIVKEKFEETKSDNKDLRKLCNILKKENTKLKKKALAARKERKDLAPSPTEEKTSSCNGVQAELGRSLKVFFAKVRPVQRSLRDFAANDLPFEGRSVEEISLELDQVLTDLRNGVANAVRMHKVERRSAIENEIA